MTASPTLSTAGREEIIRVIRQHVKVDATGLSPQVASVFMFGFEDAADAILALLPSRAQIEAEMLERCARVAEERQAICFDAADKIRADELYARLPREQTVAMQLCAAMEARHIADLIRALPADSDAGESGR